MQFEFFRLRFHFEASDSILFPPGKSANVVRGAFGTILRKIACTPACGDTVHSEACGYARIFEPKAGRRAGPSGLADWPRPFVFRTAHLDGRELRPGERFFFDAHVFDLTHPVVSYFILTLAQLAIEGIGPQRGRARLWSAEQLALDDAIVCLVFDGDKLHAPLAANAVPLSTGSEPVSRARVRFVTPAELKSNDGVVDRPEFPILFARIRDRISTLRALYGPGPLAIDFHAMGERAARIEMTHCDVCFERVERRSSRTGQVHPLGGFTGVAEYAGALAEFLPYLRAARWTGVGRQTVWGKGEMHLVE